MGYGEDSIKVHPPFGIYIMPCQVIPIGYAIGLTLGTEFRVYHLFSLTLEGGGFTTSGYMVKTNLKYYLHGVDIKENKEVACYFALEYAYKKQSYSIDDYLRDDPYTDVNYSVYKFVNTINLKYGCVKRRINPKHKHTFYTDCYFGLGIRYKVEQNNLLRGQENELYHWNQGYIDSYTNSNGRGYVPAISLGVKVGYRYR